MDQYKQYLATEVLNEGHITTYRSLSRALKVHVNLAKQMLYDFHASQNSKQPNSVHATYLVTGTKKVETPLALPNGKDGDDVVMASSPFPSSWRDESHEEPRSSRIPVKTLTLVREEELEGLKESFEEISSIHIYSLQPISPRDIHKLSIANQDLYNENATADPVADIKIYGTIMNSDVRRRENIKSDTLKRMARDNVVTAKNAKGLPLQEEIKPKRESLEPSKPAAAPTSKQKAQANTKGGALFSSFAKAKPKAQGVVKLPSKETKNEDALMKDVFDEDEDEDDGVEDDVLVAPAKQVDDQKAAEALKGRKEREEKLRKMMEDDGDGDESMQDGPDSPKEEVDDSEALDIGPKPDSPLEEEEENLEQSTTHDGRRRGRRRVMKKRTFTDEEGYLVTKEEAEWESFSEEEPDIKKLKPSSQVMSGAAAKKKVQPKGQGNIMSFFGKK